MEQGSSIYSRLRGPSSSLPPPAPLFWSDDFRWLYSALQWSIVVVFITALIIKWDDWTWTDRALVPCIALAQMFPAAQLFNRKEPYDWSKEIVLITGGGSGLGAKLARELAHRGARVAILADHPVQLGEGSRNIFPFLCDVSDRATVARVAHTVRLQVGYPTVVINNAGVLKAKLLLDLKEEDVLSSFGVNSIAPFWVTQEFLPDMLAKRKGHVVNIASVLGLLSVAQMTDYCASKAAAVSFHGSLRNELDYRYNTPEVRTTLVLAGHFKSGMFAKTVLPKWPLSLLTPSLSVDNVAASIIGALEGERTNTLLRLPRFTHMARMLGTGPSLVPQPVLRLSHWISGADWAMRDYGPKPDAGEKLDAQRVRERPKNK